MPKRPLAATETKSKLVSQSSRGDDPFVQILLSFFLFFFREPSTVVSELDTTKPTQKLRYL